MHRAVAVFLESLRELEDCHRICQTINFVDEYDGDWNGSERERADEIIRRLPDKTEVETRDVLREHRGA